MALGEAKKVVSGAKGGNKITEVSWTGGTAQDMYYGLDHSFQYSANINTDDEMHGIKLSNRADHTSSYSKCQLVSLGENGVLALPVDYHTDYTQDNLKIFQYNGHDGTPRWEEFSDNAGYTFGYTRKNGVVPGVVFQDKFWFGLNKLEGTDIKSFICSVNYKALTPTTPDYQKLYTPLDHNQYTDESIEDPNDSIPDSWPNGDITAILNYNNTRLVVAAGQDIWVYYPELDKSNPLNPDYDPSLELGSTGWKKVLTYEAGITIVALTCTFEYLKVWAVDEGWNTKVYYYQGNNNLRSTFVYNLVDLTGVRVLHVYSINGNDYYVSSIDGSDGLVDFNKLVGTTPIKLLTQRAGLTKYDVNKKSPYFVGPVGLDGPYNNGSFYVADAYGVFKFTYNPQGYDKGYMKWKLTQNTQVYGVCINKGFLYVSDSDGCWAMRLYDTGVDGYQQDGILISREFEGKEGGTITKMLDQIRLNYEMNPLTKYNGTIQVFVSPNNLWKNTDPIGTGLPADMSTYYNNSNYDGWFKVMELGQDNAYTRTDRTELLNNLGPSGNPAFKFDWQTITYAIKIIRYEKPQDNPSQQQTEAEMATPIVRQIDIRYHVKDKTNYVNGLNKSLN